MKFDLKQQIQAEVRRARRMTRLGDAPAECAECGEEDVMCLARTTERGADRVMCRRCRAESLVPSPSGYQDIREKKISERCQLCDYDSLLAPSRAKVIELHHPLGRAHHPNYTVPLCLNCHTKHSEIQRDVGVDLSPQPDREKVLAAAISSSFAHVIGVHRCTLRSPPLFRAGHLLLNALTDLASLYEIAKCLRRRNK
jgi:hypothetical protein